MSNPAQPITAAGVRRAYRFYARHYSWFFGAALEPGRRALAAAVTRLAPRTVLEVGVGTGLLLWRYPPGSAVTGIDLSADMLAVARQRVAQLGGRRIALLAMDAEAMAFPDGCFDCVTLPYMFSVTPGPDRLVAEVRRVCRRGGTILILNHFSGARRWRLLERLLRPAAERIGFRSDFRYEEQVLRHDWEVRSARSVNLGGLSKLVEIRNT